MHLLRLTAWTTFLACLALWGGFAFLVSTLQAERLEYADAEALSQEGIVRGESASRLRATVQDSEEERVALTKLVSLPLLQAVEVLEATARQAGARNVSVGGVTPLPAGKKPGEPNAVTIVINAEGSFASLIRLLSLYETLTVPSKIEQVGMEYVENTWRLTVRLFVIVAPAS